MISNEVLHLDGTLSRANLTVYLVMFIELLALVAVQVCALEGVVVVVEPVELVLRVLTKPVNRTLEKRPILCGIVQTLQFALLQHIELLIETFESVHAIFEHPLLLLLPILLDAV